MSQIVEQLKGCYNLSGLHTKQLMKYCDLCYKLGGSYDPTHNNGSQILLEDILAELNTREHVPNKKEAKLNRQARALEKK